MIIGPRRTRASFPYLVFVCTILILSAGSTSVVASGLAKFQSIAPTRAEEAARVARERMEFPVALNDLVLAELNRYAGTPEGRSFFRSSLERSKSYSALIESSLAAARFPSALSAVPLVESGYRNLPQGPNPMHGAGIWMFLATTARHFGLRVDQEVDERLDPAIETRAAIALLGREFRTFGDWNLALLAYNIGPRRVHDGINATRSRDGWTLVRAGFENDLNYLARLHAALIIIANPELLD